MTEDKDPLLKIYLQEYDKLKAEQTARIGFRDNLLYVTLGLFGDRQLNVTKQGQQQWT